jgi:outer membrane protein, heavy metal efflux system
MSLFFLEENSMKVPRSAPVYLLLSSHVAGLFAQEWTEAQVIQKFLDQSPYAREMTARVDAVRAEAAARTLLPNPSAVFSREGAGYASFYQIEQQVPWSGRRGILKQAGTAAVAATEAETSAVLWGLRSDVRLAFYRMMAAQRRQSVLAGGLSDLEGVIRILRTREAEGEGSKYDRLRAEREMAEHRSQLALAQTDIAQARSLLQGSLPTGTVIDKVSGALDTSSPVPAADSLVQRALTHRFEYIAEHRQIVRYGLEQRAAERLRYPEPTAVVGMKRGDVAFGQTGTASAVGISIPLPVFNKGRTETARWRAEQQVALARRDAIERRIRAEVAGAAGAVRLKRAAVEQYRREVGPLGDDLNRIVRVAYQEGEVGILELLDSFRVTRQALLRLVDLESLAKEAQIDLDRAVGEEVLP